MAKKKLDVDSEHEAQVRAVGHKCRGPLSDDDRAEVNRLLSAGNTAMAQKVDKAGRAGCGYDFNETILSNPLDGEEHEYKCPLCGVTGIYVAPSFP